MGPGERDTVGVDRGQRGKEALVRREALEASGSSAHFYGHPRPPGAQPSLFSLQAGPFFLFLFFMFLLLSFNWVLFLLLFFFSC